MSKEESGRRRASGPQAAFGLMSVSLNIVCPAAFPTLSRGVMCGFPLRRLNVHSVSALPLWARASLTNAVSTS